MDYLTFASYFDSVEGPREPLADYCQKAAQYRVKCVATSMFSVGRCKALLKDSDVLVSGAVSFPGGNSLLQSKLQDIAEIARQGGDEVDYVINQYFLENNDWQALYDEMKAIADFCREKGLQDKAIIEMCKLNQEEKIKVCEIAVKAGPAFIKTSTGYSYGGAKTADVKLMRSIVKDRCKIKASGGIKTVAQVLDFIEAGVDRIGSSNTIEILETYKNQLN